MIDARQELIEEIRNIKRKAGLQQYCHSVQTSRYSGRAKTLDVALIVMSALAMLLTTSAADILFGGILDEVTVMRGSAFLTFVVFIMSLLIQALRWRDLARSSQMAGNGFTRFLRRLDMRLTTIDTFSVEQLQEIGTQVTEEYNNLVDFVPDIPSKRFMRLKHMYLTQKEISRQMDKNPLLSAKEIERRLKKTIE